MHAPLRQDAVLLTRGQDQPAARALLRYLKGDRALAIMRSYGYEV
jgi:molybdate transport system substrate-binding protein